jgi:DNA ligase-1
MKPMLAAPAGTELPFPLLLSPKLDGIRCLIVDGVAVGRSLKPLPNRHVQQLFGRPELNGLDGELLVGAPTARDVFQVTTSGVMSVEGQPAVTFWVFDDYSALGGFEVRYLRAQRRVAGQRACQLVAHTPITTQEDLLGWEQYYLAKGFEGVMLRHPSGPYKHGRSTAKEAWLLKVKRFEDSEAVVLGVTELMHNANEAKRNALGHLERSSHQAGKVGRQRLGALVVRDLATRVEFEIGTGFTDQQRQDFWGRDVTGLVVKYKFQPTGVKDKPRFPVFLGFRSEVDQS